MCFDFASPRTAWIPVIFFQLSNLQQVQVIMLIFDENTRGDDGPNRLQFGIYFVANRVYIESIV